MSKSSAVSDNHTITTTVKALTEALGEPQYAYNTGDDKVNFEWDCETENGAVFTIYDWKEYRSLNENEPIEFHIGAFTKKEGEEAQMELIDTL